MFTIFEENGSINKALFNVTHGLYILTAATDDKLNGQCIDALMQVTNSPPRIAIGVGKKSLTHEMISDTGKFIVNIIDKEDNGWFDKVKTFGFKSGRDTDKFESVKYKLSERGIPILDDALAFYECNVVSKMTVDLETHTLFVGDVTKAGVKGNGEPLTYNEYRKLIKKGANNG